MQSFDDIYADMPSRIEEKISDAGLDGDGDMELDVIDIDGIEYAILTQLPLNGNTYAYLGALDDPETFMIRKIIEEDGEQFLVKLDNEEEFDSALLLFTETMLGDEPLQNLLS